MYEKIINEFKEKLKENLIEAVRFGTEGEPNNLLFVVNKLDFNDLEQIKDLVNKNKTNVVPLFFTKEELENASDVFPLEFLDIKQPHEVLYGEEDIVNQIKFDKTNVRKQVEFELRSKLIHLRENYIWIKKSKELKVLLNSAIHSLMPLFYGLLFLKDVEAPTDLDGLFKLVAEKYNVDVTILRNIKNLKDSKVSDLGLKRYVEELMKFLSILGSIVDKIKVEKD